MAEIWKTVPDYPRYEVSNQGRVRSADAKRILITKANCRTGYLFVTFFVDYKRNPDGTYRKSKAGNWLPKTKTRYVHLLVILTFRGPRPPGLQCEHWDQNKANCKLSNLKWVTPSENIKRSFAMGTRKKGDHTNRFTPKQIAEILKRHEAGATQCEIGRKMGLNNSSISRVLKRARGF